MVGLERKRVVALNEQLEICGAVVNLREDLILNLKDAWDLGPKRKVMLIGL